ncbi:MAG: bifunctional (p)ppGpp synthetase/guanosine-3',5'-bis(diphosphate) 3'-pyrophosphohydrolase [Holosporaceae bacterium]|nr:bifunctional (p)ppGpp synthetase/guanosine-3',5'-bis(diphosphate) 3'-pyrophosphohydrolase [Holosporaceae bacterium]
MLTSSELISLVKEYDPNANEDLLRKAYVFAMEAHGIQKRASGSPYFYHPAEVARFLAELKLDMQTVVTGLLHDVLEDTNVTFEELEEIFGAEIAFLVDGVTKLSKIHYTSSQSHQAENFRKFLIAISQDLRVLIVKLVDRLSNMRTLNYVISAEKRKRIALETLEIYAPLAERIGMNIIKDEIEDLAFYNLHPNEYSAISMKLDQIRSKDHNFVQNTILELRKVLKDSGINANISGREKKIYSIWKKMQRRNASLEQINDIVAFRVIVDTVANCYASLGVIHTKYQIMPGRFKDYISIPKLNNYRSLHTTVIGPQKQPVEIQIRTTEMHRIADEGIAVHWSYKNDEVIPLEDPRKYNWIKSLLTILQSSDNPEEAMDNSKLEMFENEVFCFTPDGDLITLPRGATAVDFAYEIHTDVGNTCIGAKINGKIVPLRTVLRNGDQVDIITSLDQHPKAAWESFVTTGKAKACIKKFIKAQEKAEFTVLGLQLTKYIFASNDASFDENPLDPKKFSCDSPNKFYYHIGKGIISLNAVHTLLPERKTPSLHVNEPSLCLLDFTPGIAVHFAECCHPILGDRIIGALVRHKGLMVHVTSCDRIERTAGSFIRVKWNQDDRSDAEFIARLSIVMSNETESFATITNVISFNEADITNLKVEHRSADFFDLLVDIKVKNVAHLGEVQAALRTCPAVKSVRKMSPPLLYLTLQFLLIDFGDNHVFEFFRQFHDTDPVGIIVVDYHAGKTFPIPTLFLLHQDIGAVRRCKCRFYGLEAIGILHNPTGKNYAFSLAMIVGADRIMFRVVEYGRSGVGVGHYDDGIFAKSVDDFV